MAKLDAMNVTKCNWRRREMTLHGLVSLARCQVQVFELTFGGCTGLLNVASLAKSSFYACASLGSR